MKKEKSRKKPLRRGRRGVRRFLSSDASQIAEACDIRTGMADMLSKVHRSDGYDAWEMPRSERRDMRALSNAKLVREDNEGYFVLTRKGTLCIKTALG